MNIVMIGHYFWPRSGGEERHELAVARILVERGHRVTFVAAAYDPMLPERDEVDGIAVHRISEQHPRNFGFAHRFRWFRQHRAVLDEADLVHCNDGITVTRWYLLERHLRPSLPLYLTTHGYPGFYPIPKLAKAELAVACHRARGVIGVFDLTRFYPGTRVDRVIYGGYDPIPLPPPHPDAPEHYMAFMGRLHPGQGPIRLLEAVAHWKRLGGDPPPFLLFGDGPLKSATQAAIDRLDLDARLVGQTDEPERWMAHAAFVFPGGPLALIEALAMGSICYCIQNDPVMGEFWKQIPVRGFGLAEEPEQLGELMRDDEANPERLRERAAQGAKWARTQSWARVADVYEDLWATR